MNAWWPVVVACAALLLDALFGEPRRFHPLVAFGRWARRVERALHDDARGRGVVAWLLVVLPVFTAVTLVVVLAGWLPPGWLAGVEIVVLYLTLGLRSLADHAQPVARALQADDIEAARGAVGRMVSRDTGALDASQVAGAATESVLENGNDAVFGALFWFFLLGAPGAVLYRLANTLDAMWGYRTPRHARFGWAAARIDDVLNWVPARLTALAYALAGRTGAALRCWRAQAPAWKSPNAGPVMAAGAGALQVRLGGPAPYHGSWTDRPPLGEGRAPDAGSIIDAVRLVRRSTCLWLVVAAIAAACIAHATGGPGHA